ncbi:MAG: RICIN domain-containing protein, partial [Oscillospiraceae bacterium]|nr:RICIN domain-containing protein [Oscillospiraceae bacterium]
FNRNNDGSYSIRNNKSNMYLDVEAGDNIDNLTAQPNGTNIQTYYQYNGTENQKFYIYRMFNSYYIKPVGMNRIVDMGISNGLVEVWDYADNFDPQKFDIIRIDVNNNLPTDIGQEFYAMIKNKSSGNYLTVADSISEHAQNVNGEKYNNSYSQIWKFIKDNDGSYYIQNIANEWYLDVEAGNNLENLSAQPNGTNIQTYYEYNGTTNQKFYVYNIFDSYYIKPAGTQKMVDMGSTTNLVAIWEYAGDFAPQKFDIIKINSVEKSDLYSAGYNMTLSSNSYTYDGTEKEPTVTVQNDTETLAKDTDYTVEYTNNTNAGISTVTVTGIGNYTGTLTKTFIINKAQQIINATISSNTIGIGDTSEITASGQGTISYTSSNTDVATVNSSGVIMGISAGKATITVTATGNNNYNESSKTFTVFVKNSYLLGDVNGDGVISIADATTLQKYLANIVDFDDEQLAVADTNGDGSVSISDATQIQKYLVHLIPSLG